VAKKALYKYSSFPSFLSAIRLSFVFRLLLHVSSVRRWLLRPKRERNDDSVWWRQAGYRCWLWSRLRLQRRHVPVWNVLPAKCWRHHGPQACRSVLS